MIDLLDSIVTCTTQFPASAGPPQIELLAWILVQVLFFSAACLVVQLEGGPAQSFSACLLGALMGGSPALFFFFTSLVV